MSEPHKGWFWVEEEAIRRIDRSFDKLCDARNASNCYVTLCRIANLKGADKFEISIASLARDLHCVYRDAQKALGLVEAIKLVEIERRKIPGTKENAPSRYTVIRIRPDTMSPPTDNTSEGPGRDHVHDLSRTFPKNSPQALPKKEPKRERRAAPSRDELLSFLESLPSPDPKSDADYYVLHWAENGFTNGGRPIRDYKLTLKKWFGLGYLQSQKLRKPLFTDVGTKRPSSLQDHQTF